MIKSSLFMGAVLFMLCLPGTLRSQSTGSETKPSLSYRHEIGIAASPFRYSTRGALLLYKYRFGKSQQQEMQKHQWAFRGLLGHAQEDYNTLFTERVVADTFFQRRLTGTTKRYDLALGAERQHTVGKWRWYFGGDLIFGWDNRPTHVDHLLILEGQPETILKKSEAEHHAWRIGTSAFIGLQWFFADRWSLGTEGNFSAWLEKTRNTAFSDTEYNSSLMEFTIGLPRLIYLSHHFGR